MGNNDNEAVYREAIADETLKTGEYYERLAAAVLKLLEPTSVVVHDIKLVGQVSGVKHQIDVNVERGGNQHHILIECKDFSQRAREGKVDLEIVKAFYAVCEDAKPDEAIILSCTGFTREAVKFAKGMPFCGDRCIKLMVLRRFTEDDWEGRIREIHLKLTLSVLTPSLQVKLDGNRLTQEQLEQVNEITAQGGGASAESPIRSDEWADGQMLKAAVEEQLKERVEPLDGDDGQIEGVLHLPPDAEIQLAGRWLALKEVSWSYRVENTVHETIVGADRVAALIMQLVEGEGWDEDRLIWRDELESWRFRADGEVEPIAEGGEKT